MDAAGDAQESESRSEPVVNIHRPSAPVPAMFHGLCASNPQGRCRRIRGRNSWAVRASDLPHRPSVEPFKVDERNGTPLERITSDKPDLMERRPDYLGLLGLCSLMVEQLATVHPGPRRLAPPARFTLPIRSTRTAWRVHDHGPAGPSTSVATAPTDARPPGRLSSIESNGAGHHIDHGCKEPSAFNDEQNRGLKCWEVQVRFTYGTR